MGGSLGTGLLQCRVVRGGMPSGFAKLPDWRVAFAWLVTIATATAIYFLPIARLLDSLAE
jgi:hypothetical protein